MTGESYLGRFRTYIARFHPRVESLSRTPVRHIIVAISGSMGTLLGMYLHLPARVVSCILHLCIQVDLHRTLVPILA